MTDNDNIKIYYTIHQTTHYFIFRTIILNNSDYNLIVLYMNYDSSTDIQFFDMKKK